MKKRIVSLLYLLAAVLTTLQAQARFSANVEEYNFGQIEWKMPVTAEFVITNTGDRPLVLSSVEPDCACSVAQWTQAPIAPGATGTLRVTFDAKLLGHFCKSVAVYSNAEPYEQRLYFSGQVVQQVTDYTRTHPFRIGDICLDRNELIFPDTRKGEQPTLQLSVANLSLQPYEPVLMHLPAYLRAEAAPTVLQAGERGVITLTLDTERLADVGLTQATVYLSRFLGDKVSQENEIPFSAVLLPDFSHLSDAERASAPVLRLSETEIDLSAALARKAKARHDVYITNDGRSPLHIDKLQVFDPAVSVSLKKGLLQPGETTRLRITVRKPDASAARQPRRLLMITNAPAQAKAELSIRTE